ncbi:hypothetical protein [Streptosporangium sp. NPDC002524]|uniref:hypothetical protein n=1 Tax=Streptosporangium sp. NPDC002524 TaxID=3154537 RepID=UPI0033286481
MSAVHQLNQAAFPRPRSVTPCPSWCERRHSPGYNHNRMVAGIDTVPGADEGSTMVAVVQPPDQEAAVWMSTSWYPGTEFVNGQMFGMTARDAVLLGRALVAMHGASELGRALVEAALLIDPTAQQTIDREAGVA